MKRFAFLLLAMAMLPLTWGQMQNPARWTFVSHNISDSDVELIFELQLANGWHIYSQHSDNGGPIPLEFSFEKNGDYTRSGGVKEPKAHEELDDVFNVTVRYFDGNVKFRQLIKRTNASAFHVKGTMYYQLCNDGSCVAPDDVPFDFAVQPASPQTAVTEPLPITDTDSIDGIAATSDQPSVHALMPTQDRNSTRLWGIFFGALLFGIITIFTPCVFPMIPMTVNYFMHGSDNKRRNRRQAGFFGISIVLIFTVLGALLSLIFGPESLNLIGTHGITNLFFFAVFLIFALSFFGLFEIKLPERWVNRSDAQADKGGWLAPFFIALTTVLVSFSCTGPIIGGALVGFATSTTNRWVSLLTMLGFGIGFAAPFTLLAFFPSAIKGMRSGSWLNAVKIVFAFLELAFGLKFLQMADLYWGWHLLDRDIYLALWIVIFGLMGLYLIGKLHLKHDEPAESIGVVRLFLAIATFSFVVYMVPGLWGAPLKGISGFLPPMDTQQFSVNTCRQTESPSTIQTHKYADQLHLPAGFEGFFDIAEAQQHARQTNKPIFLDFTGRNCANCREMEETVWTEPEARRMLNEEFVICALYTDMNDIVLPEDEWVTDGNRTIKTLGRRNLNYQIKQFNQNAQPCYVIVDSDGQILSDGAFVYHPQQSAATKAANFADFLKKGLQAYQSRKKIIISINQN